MIFLNWSMNCSELLSLKKIRIFLSWCDKSTVKHLRFSFSYAKQILEIYRLLCAGNKQAYETLCDLFNEETQQGENMNQYTELLKQAIEEISRVFSKRSSQKITGNDRGALLIPKSKRINEINNFELVTWLVIK